MATHESLDLPVSHHGLDHAPPAQPGARDRRGRQHDVAARAEYLVWSVTCLTPHVTVVTGLVTPAAVTEKEPSGLADLLDTNLLDRDSSSG
jgi:hypothetical protein